MSISKNIKTLREEHNLSQKEFGKIAGVSDKAVSTWENGTKIPRMGAIQKLSDYFGIPKSAIIESENESKVQTDVRFNKAFMEATKREELKIHYTQVAEMDPKDFAIVREVTEAIIKRKKEQK